MKRENRCASQCSCNHSSRRDFIRKTALFAAGASVMGDFAFGINLNGIEIPVIKPHGEALHYQPIVKAAFVRRKGDYGLRWPGAVFDGEGAKRKYTENLNATAKLLNIRLEIKETPRISWSRMNDDGIPAACEADTGAIAAHVMRGINKSKTGWRT